jgi:tight adherence protein C
MIIIAFAGVFLALTLIAWAASSQVAERTAVRGSLRQLEHYDDPEILPSRQVELKESFAPRVVLPTVQWLAGIARRFTPQDYINKSAVKLVHAGYARTEDVQKFLAIRVLTVLMIPVAWWFSFRFLGLEGNLPLAVFLFLGLALLLGPDAVLNRKVEERRYKIQMKLPDVLDLLTISVEAGLGFEQALDRTVASVPGPLSDEFGRMIGEVRAGASRPDALRAFEQRTGVPEVKSFVLAILQADAFGVSIGHILRQQADEMRVRRRQLAQERAQKAPVKMLFPMVFCIFPSLFVVVLAPAMFSITDSL